MTDVDLKHELAGLLAGEPSAGPDPMRALRGGRRAVVRRRCASSTAGLAGVVVVAAAVPFGFSLASHGGSGGTSAPNGSGSSASPVPTTDDPLRAALESRSIDPARVSDDLTSLVVHWVPASTQQTFTQGSPHVQETPLQITTSVLVQRGSESWTVIATVETAKGIAYHLMPGLKDVQMSSPSPGLAVFDQGVGAANSYGAPAVSRSRYDQTDNAGFVMVSVTSVAAVRRGGSWVAVRHDASADTAWVRRLADELAAEMPTYAQFGQLGARAVASAAASAAASSLASSSVEPSAVPCTPGVASTAPNPPPWTCPSGAAAAEPSAAASVPASSAPASR
jgi:hypothetical protein